MMVSCKKESASDLIEITTDFTKLDHQKLYKGDTISFDISSKYSIDSLWVDVNGMIQKQSPFTVNKAFHLGINTVKLTVFYNDKKKIYESKAVVYSSEKVKDLSYEVIDQYPHDSSLFTQGFYYKEGIIYESAGGTGKSKAVKYTLGAQKFLKEYKVGDEYFAEGMTYLNDSLFQLTWKKRKLFIYDKGLKFLKEYNYPRGLNEGWGITQNEQQFIISDGSSVLKYINHHDFSSIDQQVYVVDDQKLYGKLNELEYDKGIIYANVWGSDEIILINAKTGSVFAKINCKELVDKQRKNEEGVLNGIAIKGDNLLITGKNWSTIYEIKIL
ncbi:glutaminyl-peptide cyclotransferase [Flavobacteriaceae bacterium UJ101]|nr:glutaminyl-peptide cyclotransferase [Flavobacteriaceae bacterium UJ101]